MTPTGSTSRTGLIRREGFLKASAEGTNEDTVQLLAVVRLGDADRLGWWRSHGLDETAHYLLSEPFPNTWMATGVELAMESARIRHDSALERPTAIHLFSDYLPFHRLLRSWLIEQKLERDTESLSWLAQATVEELKGQLGEKTVGERRASGLFLGEIPREVLAETDTNRSLLSKLAGAYLSLESEFLAPYVDLVE
jgi:hypothetical protein